MSIKDLDFIMDRICFDETTACWNWTARLHAEGYGRFRKNGVIHLAHRYVCEAIYGPLSDGFVARHKCHNRKCCNPNHIEPGTHKDNWYDSEEMHKKLLTERALKWIVLGVVYNTIMEASNATGLSKESLSKHTNRETRIFDIDTYRENCKSIKRNPSI